MSEQLRQALDNLGGESLKVSGLEDEKPKEAFEEQEPMAPQPLVL